METASHAGATLGPIILRRGGKGSFPGCEKRRLTLDFHAIVFGINKLQQSIKSTISNFWKSCCAEPNQDPSHTGPECVFMQGVMAPRVYTLNLWSHSGCPPSWMCTIPHVNSDTGNPVSQQPVRNVAPSVEDVCLGP